MSKVHLVHVLLSEGHCRKRTDACIIQTEVQLFFHNHSAMKEPREYQESGGTPKTSYRKVSNTSSELINSTLVLPDRISRPTYMYMYMYTVHVHVRFPADVSTSDLF